MNIVVETLIEWPRRVALHLAWLAPLVARIVTGWVFLRSGWGKLNDLPFVIENFAEWGIPAPGVFGPVTGGIEFFGGILLLVGLMTRIAAGALGVVMIVAVAAVLWVDVETFFDLVALEEVMYLALFLWLAIAGAGAVSIDRLLERRAP
jgi:putative oxidoreductase